MALVTVKKKFQVVIPAAVRRKVGIRVGDLLDAKAERGKLVFLPKSPVDREIAEGLEDIRQGRLHGPFTTHQEMVRFLHATATKRRVVARKRR